MNEKLKKGDLIMLGAAEQCRLFVGWILPDGTTPSPDIVEGYNVANYFDSIDRYLGPDAAGVEPIFRDLSKEEITEYFKEDRFIKYSK